MERRPGDPDDPFDPDVRDVTRDPSLPLPDDVGDPGGPRGLIPEGVKKAILAGVGALFMTEESARRLARDWKLPKDVVDFIGRQATGAKDEVLRVFSGEIRRFLDSELVRRDFMRALSEMSIEVKAEIRVRPAEDGTVTPEVKAEVTRKRPTRAKKDRKK